MDFGSVMDSSVFIGRILGLVQTVSPLEALNASGGINQLLLPGEERMTGGTELQANIRFRRAGFELIATCAGNQHLVVLGMNSFFHFSLFIPVHSLGSQ